MKTTKKLIFKVRGVEIDSISGEEIDLQELDNLKIAMAFAHSVGTHEIDVDVVDETVRDLAVGLKVSPEGLIFRPNSEYAVFRVVDRLVPTTNINNEDGFMQFLDLIAKKDFDNALTFE